MAGKPKRRAARAERAKGLKPSRALVIVAQPEPEPPKDALGRGTKYKPEYAGMARELCDAGAVEDQVAAFFEVSRSTFNLWRNVHPEFREAVTVGKAHADDRIERSLYDRAHGYAYTEKQAIKLRGKGGVERVEIVEVERFMPPDSMSMQYWLNNRRGAEWRNRSEKVHSGTIDHEHVHTTLEQAREKIRAKMAQLREQVDETIEIVKSGIDTNSR